MKRKILIISTLCILLLGILLTAIFVFLQANKTEISDLCENKILSETDSPDKKFKIVEFARNCGMTSGYSTQVSILPENKKFSNDDSGNVFILDDQNLEISWIVGNQISIVFPMDSKIYKQEKNFENIKIEYLYTEDVYETLPNPNNPNEKIIYDRDGNPIFEIE